MKAILLVLTLAAAGIASAVAGASSAIVLSRPAAAAQVETLYECTGVTDANLPLRVILLRGDGGLSADVFVGGTISLQATLLSRNASSRGIRYEGIIQDKRNSWFAVSIFNETRNSHRMTGFASLVTLSYPDPDQPGGFYDAAADTVCGTGKRARQT